MGTAGRIGRLAGNQLLLEVTDVNGKPAVVPFVALADLLGNLLGGNASPIFIADAYTNGTPVTWTSATPVNTAYTVPVSGMDAVLASLVSNGAMAGGMLTFEAFDGAAWLPVKMGRADTYDSYSVINLTANMNMALDANTVGFTQFRVRLSSVITAGQLTVNINTTSAPNSPTETVGLDTAAVNAVRPDGVYDAGVVSGSVSSTAVVVSASTAGFAGGSFQVTATGTSSTITFEQSNDNVNWITLPITGIGTASSTASPGTTANALGIFGFVSSAAYVRARVSTFVSGTVTVVLAQKRAVVPFTGISLAGSSSTIGAVSGNLNTATGYADSTTALGAAATFTGTGRAFNSSFGPQYSFYNAQAQADQAGTLYIEASYDTGTTYIPIASVATVAVTNAAGTIYYVAQARAPLTGPFSSAALYRVVYKNGATAQATFRITSSFTAG